MAFSVSSRQMFFHAWQVRADTERKGGDYYT